ncbi:hypothetical protein LguiA_036220 [Lonicera macranthoides]
MAELETKKGVKFHDDISLEGLQLELEECVSDDAEIGSISSDIRILQDKSMDMEMKLKNRKVAESKLAKFVDDIIVPPRMIDIIVDGETSVALKDVQPELERLRQKAVSKVSEFIVQKLHALRKPKTNIQILQQSVLKCKYVISFLKEHGKEIYVEVRAAYIDTMNKGAAIQGVLSQAVLSHTPTLLGV